jgi:maltooligosyltrehalose trehalohydrolase
MSDRAQNEAIYRLHRDLLKLRREDAVFRAQPQASIDGAVLGEDAFVLRIFGDDGDDRLILINLDADLQLRPMPEPLLAPPPNMAWQVLWSSEDLTYGGSGTPPIDEEGTWLIPGQAAVVLAPSRKSDDSAPAAGPASS